MLSPKDHKCAKMKSVSTDPLGVAISTHRLTYYNPDRVTIARARGQVPSFDRGPLSSPGSHCQSPLGLLPYTVKLMPVILVSMQII